VLVWWFPTYPSVDQSEPQPEPEQAQSVVGRAGAKDVGHIVWSASILLAQRVIERAPILAAEFAESGFARPITVLELGCGVAALPSLGALPHFQCCAPLAA
jgi:hypothetical protein